MNNPITTYRIQFHKDFSFEDARRILDYLKKLGIGTLYASPVFEAVPGSVHGYDSVNPTRINPELGTEEELREISRELKQANIGWLQDIVPNHMAFHPNNEWLMDVLEKGPQSPYTPFFDIVGHKEKLMVPFLGSTLEECLSNGEITMEWNGQRFVLKYYDSSWPINPRSYETILTAAKAKPNQALQQLLEQLPQMHQVEDPETYSKQWDEFLLQLASLVKHEATSKYIQQCVEAVNKDAEILKSIANDQAYRLCHWQETDHRINFRRFFTVNGLICLNIQDPRAFDKHHRLSVQLLKEGVFSGLRIDHIDGLHDPSGYLEELRDASGDNAYIVVEKILEPGEGLPDYWPIQGNTGYDFLSMANNVFTNKQAEKPFTLFYQKLVKDRKSIHRQLHEKKSLILHRYMGGELENLYRMFTQLNLVEKKTLTTIHPEDVKAAIAEFLIQCPVYRYYGNHFPLEDEEAAAVQDIFHRIRKSGEAPARALGILERVLLHRPEEGDVEYNLRALKFYQRCMQFTGPLMAKGVEDTLMYTYQRFIGHNEVGDSPEAFGDTIDEFHGKMRLRQEQWPLSLNATSTHDTKRGEDVRARLNVITDLPDEWMKAVQEWREMNEDLKGEKGPDANDEYFIYQTLVGAWPYVKEEEKDFAPRMEEYIQKALREGKVHSDWTKPNEQYEADAKKFATSLLDKSRPFWKSFTAFLEKINDHGIVNSLSQVLLKFTCPGIPDVYQGCELWDLSLVDPDNRRPVDYEKRIQWLDAIEERGQEKEFVNELWSSRKDARIKLWLVHSLMKLRRDNPEVFSEGEYIPLQTDGRYKDHVLAFARKSRRKLYIVALPLHTAQICEEQGVDVAEIDWADTKILLPQEVDENWEDLFGQAKGRAEGSLAVKELFKALPLAFVRMAQTMNERGAGILLHVSSLPSPFGIGDLGPEAYSFANFLYRSRQKYWQLLPLNPTEAGQGHSPYSAISSRAGNPLLISPEQLAADGLLSYEDLEPHRREASNRADYEAAQSIREELLEKAWRNYSEQSDSPLRSELEEFCRKEDEWLKDFAWYALLKQENGGKPWFGWADEYRMRDEAALKKLDVEHEEKLRKIKWLQFIFFRQWKSLRAYCNTRGIQFIGDMPFYVSYDSSDVWAHRHLFAIDENGEVTGMAGVPPDAFSSDGQLWGMPVFNWEALKEQNYKWWIERLKKNMEMFDLTRLDHFRAFAAYWEVPAGEQTAKNGSWKPGPGSGFFTAMEKALGELPFVAEDLGEVNDEVFRLRDDFRFPGMKVLQFAFGDNMPYSDYIPHNYSPNFLVYTGTHDNNTVRGWYEQEADDAVRLRVEAYVGRPFSSAEVNHIMARMAYGSVARIAVLPMQDVLGLDGSARMNMPGSADSNWCWRLAPGEVNGVAEDLLRKWTILYNRE
jgi:malto-oligosyltrehalose synthase/4-alpha-glucanotransferase